MSHVITTKKNKALQWNNKYLNNTKLSLFEAAECKENYCPDDKPRKRRPRPQLRRQTENFRIKGTQGDPRIAEFIKNHPRRWRSVLEDFVRNRVGFTREWERNHEVDNQLQVLWTDLIQRTEAAVEKADYNVTMNQLFGANFYTDINDSWTALQSLMNQVPLRRKRRK